MPESDVPESQPPEEEAPSSPEEIRGFWARFFAICVILADKSPFALSLFPVSLAILIFVLKVSGEKALDTVREVAQNAHLWLYISCGLFIAITVIFWAFWVQRGTYRKTLEILRERVSAHEEEKMGERLTSGRKKNIKNPGSQEEGE